MDAYLRKTSAMKEVKSFLALIVLIALALTILVLANAAIAQSKPFVPIAPITPDDIGKKVKIPVQRRYIVDVVSGVKQLDATLNGKRLNNHDISYFSSAIGGGKIYYTVVWETKSKKMETYTKSR